MFYKGFFLLLIHSALLPLWPSTFSAIQQEPSTFFLPTVPVYTAHDYSGILIDLQLVELMNLTKSALDYADRYFALYRNDWYRKTYPAWANSKHVKNLLINKRHVVRSKLESLQHNMEVNPIPAHINPTSSDRLHRSVDISIDLAQTVTNFFLGVTSIFHMSSIHAIQKSVRNLAFKQQKLANFTSEFSEKIEAVVQTMNQRLNLSKRQAEIAMAMYIILDLCENELDQILSSLTPLVMGVIPTYLLDPATCHDAYEAAAADAASRGMVPIISNPGELLSLQTTTFAANQSWFLLLHLPIVESKTALTAFTFFNYPMVSDNVTLSFDTPSSLFAFRPGLYPDIDHVIIPLKDLQARCTAYNNATTCSTRMLHTPSCILNLYHDSTTGCQLVETSPPPPQWVPPKILLFFPKMTRIMVSCSGTVQEEEMVGLVSVDDLPFCQIKTESWTLQTSGSYHHHLIRFQKDNARIISRTAIQTAIAESSSLWLPLNNSDDIVLPHFNSTHWDTMTTSSYGTNLLDLFSITLSSLALFSVTALSLTCLWKAYRAASPFAVALAAPPPQEHEMAELQ